MLNSTSRKPRKPPAKPYPEFPLFAHRNGQWAKKVRGRFHYFGSWADPDAALNRWVDEKDDLLAGRRPRTKADGLTIRNLCNRFLTGKKSMVDTGELSVRTFTHYHSTCARLNTIFGKDRLVSDLASDDFEVLRTEIARNAAPNSVKVAIVRTRSVFKYAYDAGLIDRPVRYGPNFKVPPKRVIAKRRHENGIRMFESHEIRQMLDTDHAQWKAMLLLGINCGFGNHDVATLPKSALNLEDARVDFPRSKTGTPRRCALWPETVTGVRKAIATRPTPKENGDENLVFITVRGNRWVRLHGETWLDAIACRMRSVLIDLGLKRPGLGFYALRHSFRTVADEIRDEPAIDLIMGHTRNDMASHYRERIADERLLAVTEHVRKWLFPSEEE